MVNQVGRLDRDEVKVGSPPSVDAGLTGEVEQLSVSVGAQAVRGASSARLPQLHIDYPARVDFSVERALKRGIDVIGALLLAVLFSPLVALVFVAGAVSGSQCLFRHRRVGRDGHGFDCLKFRTMVPNAEAVLVEILAGNPEMQAEWERDHKLKDDPRVTRIGKFLRSTSLDELPQLWNVLKGEMSLVGPRPVTREELLRYGRNAVIYMMVRPGVTGLWQVSGRNNAEYRRRVAMDVCYVKKQSAVLDIWILIKTVVVVVTRHGAY
jgi:exopolysaccharide production protein ExoY